MLFLRLSELDDEPEIITFLPVSLLKLHAAELSNVIPYPLYRYFSLSLYFTILFAPNNQFLNLKLSVGFFVQASKSQTM